MSRTVRRPILLTTLLLVLVWAGGCSRGLTVIQPDTALEMSTTEMEDYNNAAASEGGRRRDT